VLRIKVNDEEKSNFGESEEYRCERGGIATDSPADNLNDNAPPRAKISKTNPNNIKEPSFATEDASLILCGSISINPRDVQDN
jgi:hypothetical protein